MTRRITVLIALGIGLGLVGSLLGWSMLTERDRKVSPPAACPDPILGMQYWVVYENSTGRIDAVMAISGGSGGENNLLPGQSALNITGQPQAGPIMCDARAGNIELWHVDLTTHQLARA